MQFNLVNNQEQVAEFVWSCVALRCMALALGFISILAGGPAAFVSSWLLLGSAFGVVAFVCFLVFPLPPPPVQGSRGLSSIVFSIELTVQCDGCLIWGLGWRAGLMAGLRVGQA